MFGAIIETNALCRCIERERRERSRGPTSISPSFAVGKLNGGLYNIDFASVQSRQRVHRIGEQMR